MDAFTKTKAPANPFAGKAKTYDPWIVSFSFVPNTDHPLQILEPPAEYFENGQFPSIRRHWVKDKSGKTMPPIVCTKGMRNTGGHCLVCRAKELGLIDADHGNVEVGEELVIPVYDHGKYRKVDGKMIPVNPAVIVSPQQRQSLLDGGVKALFASEGQFSKLRIENENVKNECADCGGMMGLTGLACSACNDTVIKQDLLNAMTMEEYNETLYSEKECSLCGHKDVLVAQRVCSDCGGTNSKNLYSVVVMARKSTSSNAKGHTRNTYTFNRTTAYKTVVPDKDDLEKFYSRLVNFLTTGPSLESQKEKLGGCLEIPTEWLKDLPKEAEPNVKKYGA